ncbi:oligosaccharide flippase family protein [Advenella alkanexedens]|uniref:oligosaccharide flippase family protein n=1 Tax=Advenella alkanexedens TaxID=1481665 RepID=UPI0026747167|nr:oligosaccharide flippase family protein [Advenella alkanexedens]WKU19006.1 oligosaccharide flippase family protein [Advenella alkanexedens]
MDRSTSNTKQAFWIALGSLFTFSFSIISSAILSRYFNKSDYGTYKQVFYIYSTLLTIFTLGLPKAYSYFLPRIEINQAKNLIKKITNLFYLMGGLLSILIFTLADHIAIFFHNPDLSLALKIFSPVPLFMLPTMGLEGILATYKMTRVVAIYTVITKLTMLCLVTLPVIIFDGNYIQSIMGFVIASFISFILALFFKNYPVKNKGNQKCETSYQEIFHFSLPLLYASLWGILIGSADQFFISRYFGKEIFAEFSNGSLELPFVGMIVGATSVVLSPIFSKMSHAKLDHQKDIFPIWKSVFEKSALLIYPLLLYTWFFADIIMVFLYGKQYENSAIYFQIKSIINFFAIIVYAPLLINTGKVKYYSNTHCFIAILVIALEYISIKTINSPYAISTISLFCQLLKTFLLLYAVVKIFNVKYHQLFPIHLIIKIVMPSVLFLSLDYYILVNLLKLKNSWILILGFLLYIIFYYIYARLIKLDYHSIIKPILNKI